MLHDDAGVPGRGSILLEDQTQVSEIMAPIISASRATRNTHRGESLTENKSCTCTMVEHETLRS